MAAEAAARERDEKIHHNKRTREWEEDEGQGQGIVKKPASEETRARMDDMRHHRQSPPVRAPSPHRPERRRSSSERPREDYHHGPPAPLHTPNVPPLLGHQPLPPINDAPRMSEPPPRIAEAHRMSEAPRDDRKEIIEPAARKVELDEDYDNEEMGDADRNPSVQVKENNSPVGNGTNGISGGAPGDN